MLPVTILWNAGVEQPLTPVSRYLNEDPWERLRKIKAKMKNTKLQMLLRGQNLLGYRHYPDDVVRKFVEHSIINGIDIIRIFDALNDFRNIEVAVDQTLKSGGHAQGAICYTISPIHNIDNYVQLGKQLEDMGVDSICIKDMSGIMGPQEAYDLITALKSAMKKPIFLHTHSTTGLGPITYYKAIEAGCDGIDCAISAFSGGDLSSRQLSPYILHSNRRAMRPDSIGRSLKKSTIFSCLLKISLFAPVTWSITYLVQTPMRWYIRCPEECFPILLLN